MVGLQNEGEGAGLRIVVDDREGPSGLAGALGTLWSPTFVGRLTVGDVEIGERVLVERKTVADFAASLEDGRLFRQAAALCKVGARPLMIVEGEDGFDVLGIPPNALRGVLLTLLVGYRIPLLRTASLSETAVTLAHLARQEQKRVGRLGNGGGGQTPGKTALEILGAIPGIGDEKARRLISGLGSLRRVALASEEELRSVPGIGPGTVRELGRALDEPP